MRRGVLLRWRLEPPVMPVARANQALPGKADGCARVAAPGSASMPGAWAAVVAAGLEAVDYRSERIVIALSSQIQDKPAIPTKSDGACSRQKDVRCMCALLVKVREEHICHHQPMEDRTTPPSLCTHALAHSPVSPASGISAISHRMHANSDTSAHATRDTSVEAHQRPAVGKPPYMQHMTKWMR